MHITIAGQLGSGKSTLCNILKNRHGFHVYSTGAIQREIAKSLFVDTLEMNDVMNKDIKYDHMIDEATTKLAMTQVDPPIIFDSRMAWKFAPESFKVYVVVDPLVAAKRVVDVRRGADESYSSTEDAQEKLLMRAKLENNRFKRIYHVDNFDYNNYNLIIDSTFLSPDAISAIIYEKYVEFCERRNESTTIMLSPKSIFPLCKIASLNMNTLAEYVESREYIIKPVTIAVYEGYHYIVDGHHRVLASILNQENYICVEQFDTARFSFFSSSDNLISEIKSVGISAVYDFEEAGQFRYASYPKYYNNR